MSITIVLFNSTYSQILERVGSFDSVREATYFRDHSDLGSRHTKLEQLGRYDEYTPAEVYSSSPNIPADASVDYSHAVENGYTQTDEGWLYTG